MSLPKWANLISTIYQLEERRSLDCATCTNIVSEETSRGAPGVIVRERPVNPVEELSVDVVVVVTWFTSDVPPEALNVVGVDLKPHGGGVASPEVKTDRVTTYT